MDWRAGKNIIKVYSNGYKIYESEKIVRVAKKILKMNPAYTLKFKVNRMPVDENYLYRKLIKTNNFNLMIELYWNLQNRKKYQIKQIKEQREQWINLRKKFLSLTGKRD